MTGNQLHVSDHDRVARRAALSWAFRRELTPQRLWPLLREAGGIESALALPQGELAARLGSAQRAAALARSFDDRGGEQWAREIERSGLSVVTAFDADYPAPLAQIADPPFVLFTAGNRERWKLSAIGIVGSREATRYGRDVATRLARELSGVGLTVVSGFARGVDAAAHQAALEGPGGTIGVLGCGLDVDYPRENARLKQEMVERHLLISEFPPGTEPHARNFPVRNRIIAGLCAGVVVVEASRRSGSLITARLATDFGRDVFAVPGSIFSPTSAGTHELLREGAILCRGVEDVLDELFPSIGGIPGHRPVSASKVELSGEARTLLELLRREQESSPEEMSRETDIPAAAVLAALFELEEAGLATSDSSGRYGLLRP